MLGGAVEFAARVDVLVGGDAELRSGALGSVHRAAAALVGGTHEPDLEVGRVRVCGNGRGRCLSVGWRRGHVRAAAVGEAEVDAQAGSGGEREGGVAAASCSRSLARFFNQRVECIGLGVMDRLGQLGGRGGAVTVMASSSLHSC